MMSGGECEVARGNSVSAWKKIRRAALAWPSKINAGHHLIWRTKRDNARETRGEDRRQQGRSSFA